MSNGQGQGGFEGFEGFPGGSGKGGFSKGFNINFGNGFGGSGQKGNMGDMFGGIDLGDIFGSIFGGGGGMGDMGGMGGMGNMGNMGGMGGKNNSKPPKTQNIPKLFAENNIKKLQNLNKLNNSVLNLVLYYSKNQKTDPTAIENITTECKSLSTFATCYFIDCDANQSKKCSKTLTMTLHSP